MTIAAQRLGHRLATMLPPVRGLNTTDAIAGMAEVDAVEMDNFISTDTGVSIREGWAEYATNIPGGEVRTIMSYEGSPMLATTSPLAQSQLFAATDQGIFDIEGGGNFTGASAAIALSGATFAGRFSFVQFTTDAGQYLIACSEVDGGYLFNGLTWMKMTSSGGPGPGIITGVDPALFVQVCAYKKRLMFVQRGTSTAWILPVGVVGGTASKFDFGPLMRHGGMLLALINWTQDAGEGTDDRLCVLGSSGDLAIYQGDDPTSATDFANVGTWFIGQPPVGRRCFTTSGGNVFILTLFGVIPVTQVVQGGIDFLLTTGTEYFKQLRKLQNVLNADFSTLANTIGWELLYISTKALLHIARPASSLLQHIQYGFQEHNLAWSRLLDVPAVTFGKRLNEIYGGTEDGRVLRIFNGSTDGALIDGTGAHEIRARVTPAFSYFGDPTVLKQALMMRVNFLSNGDPGYTLTMNVNFAISAPSLAPTPGQVIGALWDQSFWDQDIWAGAATSFGEWRSVEALGYSIAPTIYAAAMQPTTIANIEYMVKPGGPF